MAESGYRPKDLARRLAARGRQNEGSRPSWRPDETWRRETFRMPRPDAREKARDLLNRFPKAAYMTEIEWWRECENGEIEFMIRRLRSAD